MSLILYEYFQFFLSIITRGNYNEAFKSSELLDEIFVL